jgi:lipoprotein-releasing system ATP-binding protein
MPLVIGRTPWHEARKRASEMLSKTGLGERMNHRIGVLSGGEQQRVAIARALVKSPRLVLADEPTGNLDASIGDEIGGLLASFCRERKASVIIATHNEQLARRCDRILTLQDGKLKEVPSLKPQVAAREVD